MLRAVNCLDLTKVWKKFNFLILDNREMLISGKLKPSISIRNMIYKSYLVSSTCIKIIELESHYCIGREFRSVCLRGCHQIWLGGVSCHKTSQLRGRMPDLGHTTQRIGRIRYARSRAWESLFAPWRWWKFIPCVRVYTQQVGRWKCSMRWVSLVCRVFFCKPCTRNPVLEGLFICLL